MKSGGSGANGSRGVIHSYPWYVADWRLSETRMRLTLEQRALYRELLDHLFHVGSLPNNEKTLQKIAGATDEEFARAWPAVKSCFYEIEGGRLMNAKAAEVLEKLKAYQEQRRGAAKLGANARWHNPGNAERIPRGMPIDMPKTCPSSTTTTASTTSTPKPPSARADSDFDQLAARLYARHPKKSGEDSFRAGVERGAVGSGGPRTTCGQDRARPQCVVAELAARRRQIRAAARQMDRGGRLSR